MEKGLVQGEEVPIEYEDLVAPHVESFDYFLSDGMQSMVVLMPPMEVGLPKLLLCHWLMHGAMMQCASAVHRNRTHSRVDNAPVLLQIEHPVTKQRYSFWWDRPHVEMPVKEDSASELDKRLMPRDCREMVSSM
jgi:hypothetical protein